MPVSVDPEGVSRYWQNFRVMLEWAPANAKMYPPGRQGRKGSMAEEQIGRRANDLNHAEVIWVCFK